jgi:L,D-peptidoglycan transpeptidase YkuD (ErfK/YbiS/YcfS/YnhG family)
MKRTTLDIVRVFRSPLDHRRGRIVAGPFSIPCALGRTGTRRVKREGDGATPAGRFPLLGCFYRPDKGLRPRTRLPLAPLRRADGWCDDPADRRYNQPVSLPYPGRHERMWRDDGLYDVVVDIGCNRGPAVKGRGSAIFLHLARADFAPTEGCVAVPAAVVRRLLERIGPHTRIEIVGSNS